MTRPNPFRRVVTVIGLFALGLSSLGTVSPAGAQAAVTVVRLVPFRGTFPVTATWGTPAGPNHASPAIDFKMPIGTPVFATAAGSVDFVSVDARNCNL